MLRWRVAKDKYFIILSLLKLSMPWYLESKLTGWSESLNGVSVELEFVKNDLSFSFRKMFGSLEKQKYYNQNLWETHPV